MDLDLTGLRLQKEEVTGLKFMNYIELEKHIKNKDKDYCPHFEYPKLFEYLHQKYNRVAI